MVRFSRKVRSLDYQYSIDRTEITQVKTIKDSGVTFDAKLSYTVHIINLITEASRALGYIVRNSRNFSNAHVLKTIYFKSKLEYSRVIWSPYYSCHKRVLKTLKKSFFNTYISEL